jgi:nitrite reductase/ring-hydroxylating ferredoxin subunit
MFRRLTRTLAELDALDPVAGKLGEVVRSVLGPQPVKDVLGGSWLGHPLHPVLTDVTIGTYTSALLLDWLGGGESRPAARRLIGLGLLSAAPVVASGAHDWADAEVPNDAVRRIGLVHATCNVAANSLFAASFVARHRGQGGRLLALAGGAALTAGGYLGGHLSFAEGIGVDHTVFEDAVEDWTDVLATDALAENEPQCVEADGTAVMVVRHGGDVYALSEHCSHLGGPLHDGEIKDCTVTCPWHQSVFDLRDGSLVHGPAAYAQPAWDVRTRAGRVEVRRR